jgi:hypothetical protein
MTAREEELIARHLRECITRFFLRGGDAFSLEKPEALAN